MSNAGYAELHAHSSYSFLDGASSPSALVARAAELGLTGMALTDHGGLPGVVQLAQAARSVGLPVGVGSEVTLEPIVRAGVPDPTGTHLVLLARNASGYSRLSRAIGSAMLASGTKGGEHYNLEDLASQAHGEWMILTGCRKGMVRSALEGDTPDDPRTWSLEDAREATRSLVTLFGADNVAVELTSYGAPLDRERCRALATVAHDVGVSAVVTGNVHYARPADRPLADVLAATRAHRTLRDMEPYLPAQGSHLRSAEQMLALHRDHPEAVQHSVRVADECTFDIALVAPRLPGCDVPQGHTEDSWLRDKTYRGACERYGTRAENPHAWEIIDHELRVIGDLGFAGYFLIVEEIVDFCRTADIWCQGRGSAANSAVCYALGITAVDAVRHKMLFERFLSPGRAGYPDIDLDIESQRREEVIQHVYTLYGRERAAQVANVITYRPRSAIRDAAKAFGYDEEDIRTWNRALERSGMTRGGQRDAAHGLTREDLRRMGASEAKGEVQVYDGDGTEVPQNVLAVAQGLEKLPQHLGIHSGGMILCDRPIIDVCPVSWGRMPGRTVIQWDKDDCAEAGLVKFDLLGLGMLTALRISFTALGERGILGDNGRPIGLHNIPQEDPEVYALLQAADTVGVFQVESRAQMATLPRLRPECFYDIVIEVALIRPGPIQGQAVSPYLKRRRGREPITYPHPLLEPALAKTLGVPLFQEQLMRIAIDVAGFTPAQSDRLRKAMGAKRSHERMEELRDELYAGMAQRGVPAQTRDEIYSKLDAFAEFGFPESHAFSFAYLVYASAWLKVHHPEHFYAGLLAAQPMGFYSPQSLVADARRHGVSIGGPDVVYSEVHSTVRVREASTKRGQASSASPVHVHEGLELRLGLSTIKGLKKAGERIVEERRRAPFRDVADVCRRARLAVPEVEALAQAGAFESLGVSRREAVWMASALAPSVIHGPDGYQEPIPGTEAIGTVPSLPTMTAQERNSADLRATTISSGEYPTVFLRPSMAELGCITIADLAHVEAGTRVWIGGIVTHRQRPHTAKGVTFLSIEDETGLANVVCSQGLWRAYRDVARTSSGLMVRGIVERGDDALNLVADKLDVLPLVVDARSRDFR